MVPIVQDTPPTLRHKAYKYRIYPNDRQQQLIHKMFGCCRFVFNHFLEKWNTAYEEAHRGLSYNTCATQLPALKQTFDWLKEVDSIALQSAVRNLADSFDRFFQKQNEAPRFKSRKNLVQSYTTKFTNHNIAIESNQIRLPKLGWIRFAKSRELEGRILSATVRRNAAGKYFVSVVCEVAVEPLSQIEKRIGIDLGLKEFAVCSDGQRFANPKFLRQYEEKLALWQRRLSRRTQGGSNWKKAKQQVARIHETIVNSRTDFLHKLSTKLVRENQTICLENLQVVNMLKNHKLAKSIADASWGEFDRQIRYKSAWYGRTVNYADTFAPTSQACHVCGAIDREVKQLHVRQWTCQVCHTIHDRDENAAHNIARMAI